MVVGVALSAANWRLVLPRPPGRANVSQIPFVPCLFTMLGLVGFDSTRRFWWTALFIDPSIASFGYVLPKLAAESWRTSRFTRLRVLRAHDARRRIELSLHRNGHFLLRAAFDPSTPVDAHGARIVSFGMLGRWEEVGDAIRLSRYRDPRVTSLEPSGGTYASHENGDSSRDPLDPESLDGLTFRDA